MKTVVDSPSSVLPHLVRQIDPANFSEEFDRLRQRLEDMLNMPPGKGFPFPVFKDFTHLPSEIEMQEDGDRYIVKFHLPDADKWNINVNISNGTLLLSGTSNESTKESKSDRFFSHEQKVRNFQRSIALPGPVKENAIKTEYGKDYLTIILPKRPI